MSPASEIKAPHRSVRKTIHCLLGMVMAGRRSRRGTLPIVWTMLAMIGAGGPPRVHAQTCVFSAGDSFDAQIGVAPVVTGDFNGDGVTDWAGATRQQTITVFLSDGQGGVTPREPALSVGAGTFNLESIEFTNDNADDLVVRTADSVAYYDNDGTGLFTVASTLTLADITAFTAGDFDNNGVQDLVVARSSQMEILVYLGDGAGGFVSPPLHRVAFRPDGDHERRLRCRWQPRFGRGTNRQRRRHDLLRHGHRHVHHLDRRFLFRL